MKKLQQVIKKIIIIIKLHSFADYFRFEQYLDNIHQAYRQKHYTKENYNKKLFDNKIELNRYAITVQSGNLKILSHKT